jgi:branched-chain amino acid transport system substrate-binding protein
MNKRWNRITKLATVLTAISVAAVGYSSISSAAAKTSKSPIVIAGLQGTAAEGGQDFINGMIIAEKQINGSGGIDGHKVQVNVTQTQGTSEGAVSAYKAAAQNGKAIGAFLGASGGIAIRAQSGLVKMPVILADGVRSNLSPTLKYVFANTPTSELSTASLYYAVKTLHVKTIAVLHYDTDFSEQIAGYVTAGCKALGCTVTDVEAGSAAGSEAQLLPLLEKMKATNPDAYYIESLNGNGIAAARQLGMFSKPVIAEQWLTVPAVMQACGANCNGIVFAGSDCAAPSLVASSNPTRQLCQAFIKRWNQDFKGQPFGLFSMYGYDAVTTLAQAARQALAKGEPLNRSNIDTQLDSLHKFRTLAGTVTSSRTNHSLVGNFQQGFLLYTVATSASGAQTLALAPNANPSGAVGG